MVRLPARELTPLPSANGNKRKRVIQDQIRSGGCLLLSLRLLLLQLTLLAFFIASIATQLARHSWVGRFRDKDRFLSNSTFL